MNQEPPNPGRKLTAAQPWWRIWLILFTVFFLLSGIAAWMMPGKPHLVSGGWPAVALMAGVSALATSVLLIPWQLFRWVFIEHQWQRALFAVASFATLIALFYAEEDWRGYHGWTNYQREWSARGERFDRASFIPAPVPDDQNFALAPVIVSCYGQLLDSAGHEVSPRNTNLVNRLKLEYDCNSLLKLTNLGVGSRFLGVRTDFRPLQDYYRQLAAKTNLFPIPARPQSPAADVLAALGPYDATIAELRQAARLPCSRFPLSYDKENCVQILLPHLNALKYVSHLVQLRSLAELQTGQPAQALADIQLQAAVINSIRTEPFLISHLVRLAMAQMLTQPVWEGLADHRWSDAQLAELDDTLAKFDYLADYQTAIRGERGLQTEMIDFLHHHPETFQETFQSGGGDGDGDTILGRTGALSWRLIPSGWFYQNTLNCARVMTEYYLPVADLPGRAFHPSLARHGDASTEATLLNGKSYNFLARMLVAALGNVSQKFARAQSDADLARTALALERYRLAHGKFPDTLDALSPQYLQTVPNDVIGGRPLHYRLTDDGQFLLYSIGWNEKDDGGTTVFKPKFPGIPDLTQGDWVWRYPSP